MMVFPWQQTQWQRWQQQAGRYGHAYLLSGIAGLGLTEFARMMAQSVLCQSQQTERPCGQCTGCNLFDQASHADFFQLEVLDNKKEIGVDQIRQLTQDLMQTAHQGGYKVAIIQRAELLNASAFNALLKTLEEPSAQTLLILTTEQVSRLPATIISRCQKLHFSAPDLTDSQAWLQQQNPDWETTLIKRALRLNWGAPLSALAWLNNQAWLLDEQWQTAILNLQQAKQTASECATEWLKWPQPEAVFDQFYLASVQAIRRALYQPAESPSASHQAWFQFQQGLLQAKLDWQQNANKELVFEALCLSFLQLQTGQADSFSPVFESEWIRGRWA